MNGLVVGGGSIGARHLRNLRKLGVESLGLVETDSGRRKVLASEVGAEEFVSLEDGLRWLPDFVVIATPTHLHLGHSLAVASCGLPMFVEKPLSHSPDGLIELAHIVQDRKLVSLVGCNMRFHPGPAKVKELLDNRTVGRVLFARVHTGSYLPNWRPGDYRLGYASNAETGGGCLLDCIHEIDLVRWYVGDVKAVFCMAGHLSSLEINTEDVASLVCNHEGGAISELHLDYVQRTYERGCQIVGELGSIWWEFKSGQVSWFEANTERLTVFDQPPEWELNQMYLDEMSHFLDCVRYGRDAVLPISAALAVMEIVFAAKTSAREGRMVETKWAAVA